MRLSTLSFGALLPFIADAARLTIAIPQSDRIPNPSALPPSTHATLRSLGAPLSAPLTRANTFVFPNVTEGSHLMTVHCRDYAFEPLRVDVSVVQAGDDERTTRERVEVWQTFRGHEWENKGEKRAEGDGEVVAEVRPLAAKDYYQVRAGFSVLSILKNPMILMALFSMAVIFGMPYMMENMDPETKAEFEAMQKQSPLADPSKNPAAQLQNFDLASWMAGKSSTSASGASGAQPQSGAARRRG